MQPFSGPGFAVAALDTYHGGDDPCLWIVERGEVLEAVLPLVRRPLRRLNIAVDEIGFPFNPNFILNDPLLPADPAAATDAVRCLLRGLAAERFQTVVLDHLPVRTGVVQAFREAAVDIGYGVDTARPSRSLYELVVQGTFDDFLATRSAQHRWQLKKNRRRASAAGYEINCHRTRADIAAALPIWWSVVQSSWQSGVIEAERAGLERNFAIRLLDELAEDEIGELWVMTIGGRAAATLRMVGGGNRTAVHTMNYDPQFRDLAPGSVLFEAMLRDAWQRGLGIVDMHGNTRFFERWSTGQHAHESLRLYRPGVVGTLLRHARNVVNAVAP